MGIWSEPLWKYFPFKPQKVREFALIHQPAIDSARFCLNEAKNFANQASEPINPIGIRIAAFKFLLFCHRILDGNWPEIFNTEIPRFYEKPEVREIAISRNSAEDPSDDFKQILRTTKLICQQIFKKENAKEKFPNAIAVVARILLLDAAKGNAKESNDCLDFLRKFDVSIDQMMDNEIKNP